MPMRSLLRDFHNFHSNLWPGASCSPVGIGSFARCCFAIRCSSHNASLAAWGGCDSGWTAWRKLFLDFRRLGAGWWLWQGWRVSSACLLRSVLLATDLRTPGGAIPARTYRLSTFCRSQPASDASATVIEGGVDFLCMWWSFPHRTGIFCNWIAECKGGSPYSESIGTPWWICAFMEEVVPCSHFAFHFSICCLYESVRSRVTPRYTGKSQCLRSTPFHVRDSFLPTSRLRKWNKLTWVFSFQLVILVVLRYILQSCWESSFYVIYVVILTAMPRSSALMKLLVL